MKSRKLPPHTWEAHPLTEQGEMKKPYLIAVITVVAVVILILLLFVGQQFVGKAISTGQGGIFVTLCYVGQECVVPIQASITEPSVAVSFLLNYPAGITPDCTNIFNYMDERFNKRLASLTAGGANPLYVVREADCDTDNQITFAYAGLCRDAKCSNALMNGNEAAVEIAEFSFTPAAAGNYEFTFDSFEVWSLSDEPENLVTPVGVTITVSPAPPGEEVCSPATVSNGVVAVAPDCMITCNEGYALNPEENDCVLESCTDSDGENYLIKGTVTGLEFSKIMDTWEDYCGVADDEVGLLVEYICDVENYGQKVLYDCAEEGKICSLGACVEEVSAEVCDDAVDNDGDDLTDCDDNDCDDDDACILITMDDCVDADADEDGINITGSICGPIDCDDTNPSIWINVTGYYDNDGDGYGLSVNSTVSCTNGTLPTGFVTGGNDCNDVNLNVHPGVTDTPGDGIDQDCNGVDATTPPAGDGGSPGSGGGYRRCTSEWKCTNWDYCNVDLKQSRTCTDLKNCEKPKVEVQNCSKCDESWSCSLWSECQNGINNRNCYDEHNCGTVKQKPALQKGCTQTMPPGPPPGRITYQQPYVPPPIEQQPAVITEESFWSKYKAFIISIPLALILIVVIIFVAVHYLHPGKKMAYNINDLMEWIKKEKAMGTSNDDIKSILKQHTGWTDTEINQAFKNL